MMNLEAFVEVHPNWRTIRSLDRPAALATLELLQLTVYFDDQLTRDEVEVLTDEWLDLADLGPPPDATKLFDRMLDSRETIASMQANPKIFDRFLGRLAGSIQGDDARLAVFRLVAIAAAADGFDDRELDLCYALGAEFGFDLHTVEDLLRSVWEEFHEATAGTEREAKLPADLRDEPTGSDERRTLEPRPNPFSSRA